VNTTDLGSLPLPEAARAWLESRKDFLGKSTYRDYVIYVRTLGNFFGNTTQLATLTGDDILRYQHCRLEKVDGSSINKEASILQQLLKRTGRWSEIGHDYQPLPTSKESRGRALTDAERQRLFAVAASSPSRQATYLFAVISVNTTAGPSELLTLRLQDIDTVNRTIRIQPEGAKNAHRVRVIPLNDESLSALTTAMARAATLGSHKPEHYLFPFRSGGGRRSAIYDPRRHQRSFYKAWREITAEAGLFGFRLYDLRHTAITKLLENPDVSEETTEAIAGHVSHRMKKRYSHVRIEVRRAAIQAMSNPIAAPTELHNQDIRTMLDMGLSADTVAAKISTSACRFDTSLNALRQLKNSDVPEIVIRSMVKGGAR
jgi:integrase